MSLQMLKQVSTQIPHIFDSFLPSSFGRSRLQSFTRVREPTLLRNQLHSSYERACQGKILLRSLRGDLWRLASSPVALAEGPTIILCGLEAASSPLRLLPKFPMIASHNQCCLI
jgi:hypothetical protein